MKVGFSAIDVEYAVIDPSVSPSPVESGPQIVVGIRVFRIEPDCGFAVVGGLLMAFQIIVGPTPTIIGVCQRDVVSPSLSIDDYRASR